MFEFLYWFFKPKNVLVKVGEEVDSERVLFIKFVTIGILNSLKSLSGSSVLQKDVPVGDIGTINTSSVHKLKLQGKLKPIPFGCAISLWVEFCCNCSKLGEDLMDDIFEFFQSLRANLWHVIYHHHRVDAISLLRLLPQDVIQ